MTMGCSLEAWLAKDPRERAFFATAWNEMHTE